MRHEAGAVRGYGRRLFTQAHARRLVAYDPTADDRIPSVELRQERQFLSHETFGAISIADPREAAAGADEFDVRTFARIERLARIAPEPRSNGVVLEIAGKQVRVFGRHLPKQREHALVGKDHLPWRLDEARRRDGGQVSEGIGEHPLPGVELKQMSDRPPRAVDKGRAMKTDIAHVQSLRRQPRLSRAVLDIGQRDAILD